MIGACKWSWNLPVDTLLGLLVEGRKDLQGNALSWSVSWSRAYRLHMTSIAPEAFLGLLHLRIVDTTGNPEPVLVRLPPTAPRPPRAAGP